ncbi:HAD family hydrolase, partial [Priestia megaterium]
MQKQTLLFNLDDTLVHCNKYFRDTINAFVAQLQEWFKNLTKEEIKQKQLEID